MERTRTPESLRALGEATATLTPEEQLDFLGGFMAGHDRLADEIHRQVPRTKEDRRPALHDAIARAISALRTYMENRNKE